MGTRLSRAAALTLLCVALGGCSSAPPPETKDVQAEIDDILVHFANPNEGERWRAQLLEVARRGQQERATTLASLDREYTRSWRRGGTGSALTNAGRRRVMEVVTELGDGQDTRALLTKGLKDDEPNVVAAAAHGLASWNDAGGLERLLTVAHKTEGPGREHALAALDALATPTERARFLAAHTGDDAVLFAATLATFPEAAAKRREALQQVAEGHANAHARTFAIQALSKLGVAPSDVAADALHDATTRPAALRALEKSGDAEALAAELATNPADADRVAGHLYRIEHAEAAEAAARLVSGDAPDDLRLIVLQEVFAPAATKRPSAYAAGRGKAALVEALRGAIERERGQAQRVAVLALGRLGDPAIDEGSLLRLQGGSTELDRALLVALGHLGGEVAAAHLLLSLETEPELGEAAGEGLVALVEGGHGEAVSGADLLALLDHDRQEVREQALAILQALAGSKDARGYKPGADRESRQPGIAAWRDWVRSR
ncbi:MAG: hypothetical protein R3F62_21820 [Planctomycetota bacterium]